MSKSVWFNIRHARPSAGVRLVCFPWSGGGSQWYANWGRLAPSHVEVVGVTFPQRESRFKDPPCDSMSQLVGIISAEMQKHLADKPLAFYGHSMGVSTSFEVARHLVEKEGITPAHLFFSGHYSPHSKIRQQRRMDKDNQMWHKLSDSDLIERVKGLGGTPPSILADKDYMQNIFLPPFRADLKIAEGYWYEKSSTIPPLTCPVIVINGEGDKDFQMAEFAELTSSGNFKTFTLPGGHFYFIQPDNSQKLMDIISTELKGLLEHCQ